MKTQVFKKLIKESVREVIQEELKEILLESLKSQSSRPVMESQTPQPAPSTPQASPEELRNKYANILNETANAGAPGNKPKFDPSQNADPVNGNLGEGEVSMDQINQLFKL